MPSPSIGLGTPSKSQFSRGDFEVRIVDVKIHEMKDLSSDSWGDPRYNTVRCEV